MYSYSQNIKCEITDYIKKLNDKEYSTYQFVNASYSYSRPLLILVTDNKTFMKTHLKIPLLFSAKQEYTDVNLLGINGFDKNNISEFDKKIIDVYIEDIMKYRSNNNLPTYSNEQIRLQINYIDNVDDLCKFLIWKKQIRKK